MLSACMQIQFCIQGVVSSPAKQATQTSYQDKLAPLHRWENHVVHILSRLLSSPVISNHQTPIWVTNPDASINICYHRT